MVRTRERIAAGTAWRTGVEQWNYCLLGENLFYEFRDKGATMEEILQFSRVRVKPSHGKTLFV
ncbi:MAG TPA: hypothetical protein VN873_20545 [Candidatus Angelobacter sp.]|nr:hypothetical protein [Candidatus Angelobacter sp.]